MECTVAARRSVERIDSELGRYIKAGATDYLPAHFGDPLPEDGDQLYHTEARRMTLEYMIDSPLYALPSQSPKWSNSRILSFGFGRNQVSGKEWLKQTLARDIQQCGDAQPLWDKAWNEAVEAESPVDPDRRQFYEASVLTMIAINRQMVQVFSNFLMIRSLIFLCR